MRPSPAAVFCQVAVLAAAPGFAQVKPLPRPWEDPDFDKPHKAALREALEFTPIFNSARARPPRTLRLLKVNPAAYQDPDRLPPTVLLGDMLWHAPKLLGERARRFGVSCNSCHPNGAVTNTIDAGESSDRKGNIDLLSDYFSPLSDDGIWAPRNVASLRGARFNWPYLRSGALHSLSEGVVATITGEFAQVSRPEYVAALTVFLFEQDFAANDKLDELGRLTAKAPAAAHEGEKVFKASREGFGGKSCASCHVPDSYFTDHRPHPLAHGSGKGIRTAGEGFKTSTLLNLAESWPYFFDGSADTLAEAVEVIDARHQLGLSAAHKASLTAYLTAVGGVDEGPRVPSLKERFDASLPFLSLVLVGPYQDDAGVWDLTLDTVRHELRSAVRDASPAERAAVESLVRDYEKLVAGAEAKSPNAATRAELGALRKKLLAAAAPKAAQGSARAGGAR
jgi:mono/diheme cytochrome c family protein